MNRLEVLALKRERVRELHEKGLSESAIAQRIGMSIGFVKATRRALGLVSDRPRYRDEELCL